LLPSRAPDRDSLRSGRPEIFFFHFDSSDLHPVSESFFGVFFCGASPPVQAANFSSLCLIIRPPRTVQLPFPPPKSSTLLKSWVVETPPSEDSILSLAANENIDAMAMLAWRFLPLSPFAVSARSRSRPALHCYWSR